MPHREGVCVCVSVLGWGGVGGGSALRVSPYLPLHAHGALLPTPRASQPPLHLA